MTFADIQPELGRLAVEDKRRAAAYLIQQLRSGDPDYQEAMAQRHRDMDAGKKVSFADFKALLTAHGE